MTEQTTTKPNCYECKHRGNLPGSAHSCCEHPSIQKSGTAMDEILAVLSSVQRVPPMGIKPSVLGIRAAEHGIRKGWFNWPYNFDPVWLEACDGFKQKG